MGSIRSYDEMLEEEDTDGTATDTRRTENNIASNGGGRWEANQTERWTKGRVKTEEVSYSQRCGVYNRVRERQAHSL